MRALTWHGKHNVKVETVEDPGILEQTDAIVEVTASAICGSDLHIYNGYIATMQKGDVLGHEFAGVIVEVGTAVKNVKVGDRVVIPFTISCGACYFCQQKKFALCLRSNPNAKMLADTVGYATAGLFGYSHLYGGFSGGQAQYVRVPFVDTGALVLPEQISEEHGLFLSDVFPTGYMAAENCQIKKGDTVAVWGAGPVGRFAARSALLLGAKQVFVIDDLPERLQMAEQGGAVAINRKQVDVFETLREHTAGLGPNACIDAVGLEAHGETASAMLDNVLQALKIETDRSEALREAIMCCQNGGTVSIPGVYIGILDNFPLGKAFAKGLTFRMGQTHVQRYLRPLLEHIVNGDIDPRFVITDRITLEQAPDAYHRFCHKDKGCIKFVLDPRAN